MDKGNKKNLTVFIIVVFILVALLGFGAWLNNKLSGEISGVSSTYSEKDMIDPDNMLYSPDYEAEKLILILFDIEGQDLLPQVNEVSEAKPNFNMSKAHSLLTDEEKRKYKYVSVVSSSSPVYRQFVFSRSPELTGKIIVVDKFRDKETYLVEEKAGKKVLIVLRN